MRFPSRRSFLAGLAAALAVPRARAAAPIRALTKGPKFHWFGYYDKWQFDATSRYVLGMEVDFEHRSPRPDDVIRVGVIDTADGDRWTELGTSSAWCWQQGCMLQWLPGSSSQVIWNDREDGQYVSRVVDIRSGKSRTLPMPVYALSPDAKWAVSTDFRRLNDTRPGYGYTGIPDPNAGKLTPDDVGIWKMDLASGKSELIYSVAQAAAVPNPHNDTSGLKHYFNHLLVSTNGSRLIFLHRWRFRPESGRSFGTRMFTVGSDGRNPYVLDPYGKTSHFIWRDPEHVLAWAYHPSHGDKFYLYRDRSEKVDVVGPEVMIENGHCTYLPGNRWILNDTYPDKAKREQHVYLYQVATGKRIPLADLYSPPEYTGEWRCDTHPRFSPDGKKVVVDSAHAGGRQLYLIDVAELVS
ncbi:MAG: hypothetical protein KDC27_20795 [Acidobacteria bacterium]|nr:hypothetical protein [Acidobacteriota bacterium]